MSNQQQQQQQYQQYQQPSGPFANHRSFSSSGGAGTGNGSGESYAPSTAESTLFAQHWQSDFASFHQSPSMFLSSRNVEIEEFVHIVLQILYSDRDEAIKIRLLGLMQEHSQLLFGEFSRLEHAFASLQAMFTQQSSEASYFFKGQILVTLTVMLLEFNMFETQPQVFTQFIVMLLRVISRVNNPFDRVQRASAFECLREIEMAFPGCLWSRLGHLFALCQEENTHVCQHAMVLFATVLRHASRATILAAAAAASHHDGKPSPSPLPSSSSSSSSSSASSASPFSLGAAGPGSSKLVSSGMPSLLAIVDDIASFERSQRCARTPHPVLFTNLSIVSQQHQQHQQLLATPALALPPAMPQFSVDDIPDTLRMDLKRALALVVDNSYLLTPWCLSLLALDLSECIAYAGLSPRVFKPHFFRLVATHSPLLIHAVILLRLRFGADMFEDSDDDIMLDRLCYLVNDPCVPMSSRLLAAHWLAAFPILDDVAVASIDMGEEDAASASSQPTTPQSLSDGFKHFPGLNLSSTSGDPRLASIQQQQQQQPPPSPQTQRQLQYSSTSVLTSAKTIYRRFSLLHPTIFDETIQLTTAKLTAIIQSAVPVGIVDPGMWIRKAHLRPTPEGLTDMLSCFHAIERYPAHSPTVSSFFRILFRTHLRFPKSLSSALHIALVDLTHRAPHLSWHMMNLIKQIRKRLPRDPLPALTLDSLHARLSSMDTKAWLRYFDRNLYLVAKIAQEKNLPPAPLLDKIASLLKSGISSTSPVSGGPLSSAASQQPSFITMSPLFQSTLPDAPASDLVSLSPELAAIGGVTPLGMKTSQSLWTQPPNFTPNNLFGAASYALIVAVIASSKLLSASFLNEPENIFWSIGNAVLLACRPILNHHSDSPHVRRSLGHVLDLLANGHVDVDIRDRARFYHLLLDRVNGERLSKILHTGSASSIDGSASAPASASAVKDTSINSSLSAMVASRIAAPSSFSRARPTERLETQILTMQKRTHAHSPVASAQGQPAKETQLHLDDGEALQTSRIPGPASAPASVELDAAHILESYTLLLASGAFDARISVSLSLAFIDDRLIPKDVIVPDKLFAISLIFTTPRHIVASGECHVPYLSRRPPRVRATAPSADKFPFVCSCVAYFDVIHPLPAVISVQATFSNESGQTFTGPLEDLSIEFADLLCPIQLPAELPKSAAVMGSLFDSLWASFDPSSEDCYESVKVMESAESDVRMALDLHLGAFAVPSSSDGSNLILRFMVFLPPKYHLLFTFDFSEASSAVVRIRTNQWKCLCFLDSFLSSMFATTAPPATASAATR